MGPKESGTGSLDEAHSRRKSPTQSSKKSRTTCIWKPSFLSSKNKYKNIKAKNDYERSMKLIRFALGRGYGMDVIHKCIDKMKEEDLGDIDFEDDF